MSDLKFLLGEDENEKSPVDVKPYSEWAVDNTYNDAIESKVAYTDYLRESFIDAKQYNTELESEIRNNLAFSLVEEKLADPEDTDFFASLHEGVEPSFDRKVNLIQSSIGYEDDDWKALTRYKALAKVIAEDPRGGEQETRDKLIAAKANLEPIVASRFDDVKKAMVNSGELAFATVLDEEGNKKLIAGSRASEVGLLQGLKESKDGGVTLADAYLAQQELSNVKGTEIPLYHFKRLKEAHDMIVALTKEDESFGYQVEGHANRLARREHDRNDRWQWMLNFVKGAVVEGTGQLIEAGKAIVKGENIKEYVAESGVGKAIERSDKVWGAGSADITDSIKHLAERLNTAEGVTAGEEFSLDEVRKAYAQALLTSANNRGKFEFHDDDDELGKNIRTYGFLGPTIHPNAMAKESVFNKMLDSRPDIDDETKEGLRQSRTAWLDNNFLNVSKLLLSSGKADIWQDALTEGRIARKQNHEILDDFLEDPDNFSEFAERAKGIGWSILDAFTSMVAAIPAMAGNEFAQDVLVKTTARNQLRREVAGLFGEEFGFWQDVGEAIAPLTVDLAATAALAFVTTPAAGTGGAAYLAAKQGARLTAMGFLKTLTSGALRVTAEEGATTVAKNLIAQKLIRESVAGSAEKGAMAAVRAYNSALAHKIGTSSAVFLTAANRSSAATYGSISYQLQQTTDLSDEEIHDRALGGALTAGAITGFVTSAFSFMGRGGIEDALLKGMSFKQAVSLVKSMGNVKGLGKGQVASKIADGINEQMLASLTGLKAAKYGAAKAIFRGAFNEFTEETIDEFLTGIVQDAVLNENTPFIEAVGQSLYAGGIGAVLGSGSPAIQKIGETIKTDRFLQYETAARIERDFVTGLQERLESVGLPLAGRQLSNLLRTPVREREAFVSGMIPGEETAAPDTEQAWYTNFREKYGQLTPMGREESQQARDFAEDREQMMRDLSEAKEFLTPETNSLLISEFALQQSYQEFEKAYDSLVPAPDGVITEEQKNLIDEWESNNFPLPPDREQWRAAVRAKLPTLYPVGAARAAEETPPPTPLEEEDDTDPTELIRVLDTALSTEEGQQKLQAEVSKMNLPYSTDINGQMLMEFEDIVPDSVPDADPVDAGDAMSSLSSQATREISRRLGADQMELVVTESGEHILIDPLTDRAQGVIPYAETAEPDIEAPSISDYPEFAEEVEKGDSVFSSLEQADAFFKLAAEGFPVRLSPAQTYGLPLTGSYAEKADALAKYSYSFYPVIPVSKPDGGESWKSTRKKTYFDPYSLERKTDSKMSGFVDRNGRGVFNNDPVLMAEMLAHGIPIPIPEGVENMNPAIVPSADGKWVSGVRKVSSDRQLKESAVTPLEKFGAVEPNNNTGQAWWGLPFIDTQDVTDAKPLPEGSRSLTQDGGDKVLRADDKHHATIVNDLAVFSENVSRNPSAYASYFKTYGGNQLEGNYREQAVWAAVGEFKALAHLFEFRQFLLSDGPELTATVNNRRVVNPDKVSRVNRAFKSRVTSPPAETRKRLEEFLPAHLHRGKTNRDVTIAFINEMILNNSDFDGDQMPTFLSILDRTVGRYVSQQSSSSDVAISRGILSLDEDGVLDEASMVQAEDIGSHQADIVPSVEPIGPQVFSDTTQTAIRDAVSLIDQDEELKAALVDLARQSLYENATASEVSELMSTPTRELLARLGSWMETGSHAGRSNVLEFTHNLEQQQFQSGLDLRNALVTSGFHLIEGNPADDADFVEQIRFALSTSLGETKSVQYAKNFINAIGEGMRIRRLSRSYLTKQQREAAQASNEAAVSRLGLQDGNPDTVVNALETISKTSTNRSHRLVASLLLEDPYFIRQVRFSMIYTHADFAGEYTLRNNGVHNVTINLATSNGRGLENVLLEEYVHAFLASTMAKGENQLSSRQLAARRRLENLYKAARDYYSKNYIDSNPSMRSPVFEAGLENIDEFVTSFLLSPDFQKFVKTMEPPKGQRGFFKRILDAMVSMFRKVTGKEVKVYSDALQDIVELSRTTYRGGTSHLGTFVAEAAQEAVDVERRATSDVRESRPTLEVTPTKDDKVAMVDPEWPAVLDDSVDQDQDSENRDRDLATIKREARRELADSGLSEEFSDLMDFMKGRVPFGVTLKVDFNTVAPAYTKGGVLYVNPLKIMQVVDGMDTLGQRGYVDSIIHEELGHVASWNSLSVSDINTVVMSLSESDFASIANEYYQTQRDKDDSSTRRNSSDALEAKREKVRLVEEKLRMRLQKVTRGFTTEEDIAFWKSDPSLLAILKRYISGVINRIVANRRLISASHGSIDALLVPLVHEMRAIQAGFGRTPILQNFDPDNPSASVQDYLSVANEDLFSAIADEQDKSQMVALAATAGWTAQDMFESFLIENNMQMKAGGPYYGGYTEQMLPELREQLTRAKERLEEKDLPPEVATALRDLYSKIGLGFRVEEDGSLTPSRIPNFVQTQLQDKFMAWIDGFRIPTAELAVQLRKPSRQGTLQSSAISRRAARDYRSVRQNFDTYFPADFRIGWGEDYDISELRKSVGYLATTRNPMSIDVGNTWAGAFVDSIRGDTDEKRAAILAAGGWGNLVGDGNVSTDKYHDTGISYTKVLLPEVVDWDAVAHLIPDHLLVFAAVSNLLDKAPISVPQSIKNRQSLARHLQWDNSTQTIQFERLTFPDQEPPKLIGGVYDVDDDANAELKRMLLNQIGTRARLGSNLPNISGDSAGMYLMTIGGLMQSLGLTATFEAEQEGLSFTEDPDHPTYVGLKDDYEPNEIENIALNIEAAGATTGGRVELSNISIPIWPEDSVQTDELYELDPHAASYFYTDILEGKRSLSYEMVRPDGSNVSFSQADKDNLLLRDTTVIGYSSVGVANDIIADSPSYAREDVAEKIRGRIVETSKNQLRFAKIKLLALIASGESLETEIPVTFGLPKPPRLPRNLQGWTRGERLIYDYENVRNSLLKNGSSSEVFSYGMYYPAGTPSEDYDLDGSTPSRKPLPDDLNVDLTVKNFLNSVVNSAKSMQSIDSRTLEAAWVENGIIEKDEDGNVVKVHYGDIWIPDDPLMRPRVSNLLETVTEFENGYFSPTGGGMVWGNRIEARGSGAREAGDESAHILKSRSREGEKRDWFDPSIGVPDITNTTPVHLPQEEEGTISISNDVSEFSDSLLGDASPFDSLLAAKGPVAQVSHTRARRIERSGFSLVGEMGEPILPVEVSGWGHASIMGTVDSFHEFNNAEPISLADLGSVDRNSDTGPRVQKILNELSANLSNDQRVVMAEVRGDFVTIRTYPIFDSIEEVQDAVGPYSDPTDIIVPASSYESLVDDQTKEKLKNKVVVQGQYINISMYPGYWDIDAMFPSGSFTANQEGRTKGLGGGDTTVFADRGSISGSLAMEVFFALQARKKDLGITELTTTSAGSSANMKRQHDLGRVGLPSSFKLSDGSRVRHEVLKGPTGFLSWFNMGFVPEHEGDLNKALQQRFYGETRGDGMGLAESVDVVIQTLQVSQTLKQQEDLREEIREDIKDAASRFRRTLEQNAASLPADSQFVTLSEEEWNGLLADYQSNTLDLTVRSSERMKTHVLGNFDRQLSARLDDAVEEEMEYRHTLQNIFVRPEERVDLEAALEAFKADPQSRQSGEFLRQIEQRNWDVFWGLHSHDRTPAERKAAYRFLKANMMGGKFTFDLTENSRSMQAISAKFPYARYVRNADNERIISQANKIYSPPIKKLEDAIATSLKSRRDDPLDETPHSDESAYKETTQDIARLQDMSQPEMDSFVSDKMGKFRRGEENLSDLKRELVDAAAKAANGHLHANGMAIPLFTSSSPAPSTSPASSTSPLPDELFKNFVQLLELPLYEIGGYEAPKGWINKLIKGDVGEPVKRFIKHREEFNRGAALLVKAYKTTLDKLVDDYFGGWDNTPEDMQDVIAHAQGFVDGNILSSDAIAAIDAAHEARVVAIDNDPDLSSKNKVIERKASAQQRDTEIEAAEDSAIAAIEARTKAAMKDLEKAAPKLASHIRDIRHKLLRPMQEKLIGSGIGSGLAARIDKTGGIYITRTYQGFNDPTFFDRVREDPEYADVREAAMSYFTKSKYDHLYDQAINKGLSDADARKEAEDEMARAERRAVATGWSRSYGEEQMKIFLSRYDGKPTRPDSFNASGFQVMEKNLKRRKDLPKPIRDLLGELGVRRAGEPGDDTGTDLILRTFSAVATLTAQQAFLSDLAKVGVETGFLVDVETMKNDPQYSDWVPLRDGTLSENDPLKYLYASPSLKEALQQTLQPSFFVQNATTSEQSVGALAKVARNLTGKSMAMKTLGSVGFFLRNTLGNLLFFGPAQGFYRIDKMLSKTVSHTWSRLTDPDKMDLYLAELTGLGIAMNSVRSGIMRELLTGRLTPKGVYAQVESLVDDIAVLGPTAKGVKLLEKKAIDLSEALDDAYKIAYFENELGVLRKAHQSEQMLPSEQRSVIGSMSDYGLKREAARKVKMTAQSLSEAPEVVTNLSHSGFGLLFAPFLRFKTEVPRIVINTYKLSFDEIASDNDVIRARGFRRFASMTGMLGVVSAAGPAVLAAMSGIGDDEDEALRKSMPIYLRGHSFWWVRDKKTKELRSMDLTYMNPFSLLSDPTMRAMHHMLNGDFGKAASRFATGLVFDTYLDDQILASSISDVLNNKNETTGRSIWIPEVDNTGKVLIKSLGHILKEAYEPRTLNDAIDAAQAVGGDYSKWSDSPVGELMDGVWPIKVHQVDLEQQFRRFIRDHTKRVKEVSDKKYRIFSKKPIDKDNIRDLYEDEVEGKQSLNAELLRVSRGFARLGLDHKTQYQMMVSLGVGKEKARLMFFNVMDRPSINKRLVEELYKRNLQHRLGPLIQQYETYPRYLSIEPKE